MMLKLLFSSMMDASNFNTTYTSSIAKEKPAMVKTQSMKPANLTRSTNTQSFESTSQIMEHVPPQNSLNPSFASERPSSASSTITQTSSAAPKKISNSWSTTYSSTFDGHNTMNTVQNWQKIEATKYDPTVITNPNLKDISDNPFSRNRVLRNVSMKSTTHTDFGSRGENPLSRFDLSLGKDGLKHGSTTADLNVGSAKAHPARIPGTYFFFHLIQLLQYLGKRKLSYDIYVHKIFKQMYDSRVTIFSC
jgi:hypothetical protein